MHPPSLPVQLPSPPGPVSSIYRNLVRLSLFIPHTLRSLIPHLNSLLDSSTKSNLSLLISPLSYTLPEPCPIRANLALILERSHSHPRASSGQHANQPETRLDPPHAPPTLGVDQVAESSNSIPAILPQHAVSTSLVDLHLCKRDLAYQMDGKDLELFVRFSHHARGGKEGREKRQLFAGREEGISAVRMTCLGAVLPAAMHQRMTRTGAEAKAGSHPSSRAPSPWGPP
jgi:hypothetical protein